jgi:hypothetical protein
MCERRTEIDENQRQICFQPPDKQYCTAMLLQTDMTRGDWVTIGISDENELKFQVQKVHDLFVGNVMP